MKFELELNEGYIKILEELSAKLSTSKDHVIRLALQHYHDHQKNIKQFI